MAASVWPAAPPSPSSAANGSRTTARAPVCSSRNRRGPGALDWMEEDPAAPAGRIALWRPSRNRTDTVRPSSPIAARSEEHTSELQSRQYLVCRLLLEKKKKKRRIGGDEMIYRTHINA